MTLLTIRDLTLVRGDRSIVEKLSFSLAGGEVLALMGASGTGKSTVLRAIAGLDPIAGGAVEIAGLTLSPGSLPEQRVLRELHRRVGVVFQFHHLFAHKRALENVWLAPVHVSQRPRPEAVSTALDLLRQLGVEHRAHAYPHELSGGEAQRVAIARALAMEPSLLLMDEPTASLDANRRGDLAATLRQLAAQGRTLLVATHDVDFVRAAADRVIVLDGGRVIRDGRASEVF